VGVLVYGQGLKTPRVLLSFPVFPRANSGVGRSD
jgi:hypothetical protein